MNAAFLSDPQIIPEKTVLGHAVGHIGGQRRVSGECMMGYVSS